jgi:hypothetical protein
MPRILPKHSKASCYISEMNEATWVFPR